MASRTDAPHPTPQTLAAGFTGQILSSSGSYVGGISSGCDLPDLGHGHSTEHNLPCWRRSLAPRAVVDECEFIGFPGLRIKQHLSRSGSPLAGILRFDAELLHRGAESWDRQVRYGAKVLFGGVRSTREVHPLAVCGSGWKDTFDRRDQ